MIINADIKHSYILLTIFQVQQAQHNLKILYITQRITTTTDAVIKMLSVLLLKVSTRKLHPTIIKIIPSTLLIQTFLYGFNMKNNTPIET